MHYKFYSSLPKEAIHIRKDVFIKEQGFQNEFDDIDDRAMHLVLYEQDAYIGCARMYEQEGVMVLGRIAILKAYRGLHIGSYVLSILEAKAKTLGYHKVMLSAQVRASHFYEKNGYIKEGEEYFDEYCPHVHMIKVL